MKTLTPASRVEALEHLWVASSFAADLLADATTRVSIRSDLARQVRCDLHALGVTSDELDAAGIR